MPGWIAPVVLALLVLAAAAALDVRSRRHDPRADDPHWVGGVLYYNRDDPRVVVPKRYGLGLGRTMNFAHPLAWIVLVVPIAIAVVSAARRHG